jgi:hypothetical protein
MIGLGERRRTWMNLRRNLSTSHPSPPETKKKSRRARRSENPMRAGIAPATVKQEVDVFVPLACDLTRRLTALLHRCGGELSRSTPT